MGVLEWCPIVGYEGRYSVSNNGLVYSHLSEKTLKPNTMSNGYLSVELFNKEGSKRICIHRLVANAFLENPNNHPVVNHKDENKQNNSVDNLEWCTQKYNVNYGNALEKKKKNRKVTDAVKNALLMGHIAVQRRVIQFTKTMEFVSCFESVAEAGRLTMINSSHITEVCKHKRKSAGGYIWKYEMEV